MCFQKIREGVEKVMSSWGGVFVEDDGWMAEVA